MNKKQAISLAPFIGQYLRTVCKKNKDRDTTLKIGGYLFRLPAYNRKDLWVESAKTFKVVARISL